MVKKGQDKPKNICLLHGWGANVQRLIPLKKELEKLGWQVLLPKLPFFDLPEPANPWNLDDFVTFVNKETKKFFKSEPYSLFGHSFGGRIAIKISSCGQPNLNSLVLCAAAGISRPNVIKRNFFKLLAKTSAPFRKIGLPFEQTAKKIVYRLAGASDYKQISSRIKKETFQNVVEEDLRPIITQITVPTLILWGEKDQTTPLADAHFLKKSLNRANLLVFPNEDHLLPYHQPKNLAKKIERWFLSL